jgi:Fe-S-cluster containining protein
MKTDYNAKEFYDTTKTPLKVIELSDRWIYLMHFPCKHQDENNKCSIYNQKRPVICELFPEYEISNLWKLFCPLSAKLNKDKAGVLRHF